MQNQTIHRAAVRTRYCGDQIESVAVLAVAPLSGLGTGATPAASS